MTGYRQPSAVPWSPDLQPVVPHSGNDEFSGPELSTSWEKWPPAQAANFTAGIDPSVQMLELASDQTVTSLLAVRRAMPAYPEPGAGSASRSIYARLGLRNMGAQAPAAMAVALLAGRPLLDSAVFYSVELAGAVMASPRPLPELQFRDCTSPTASTLLGSVVGVSSTLLVCMHVFYASIGWSLQPFVSVDGVSWFAVGAAVSGALGIRPAEVALAMRNSPGAEHGRTSVVVDWLRYEDRTSSGSGIELSAPPPLGGRQFVGQT